MVLKFGALTSDKDAMKKDIVKRILYTEAETMLEMGRAVVVQGIDQLSYGMTFPTVERLDPQQVTEGTIADYQKLSWAEFYGSMKKFQDIILTTDEANARNQMNIQMPYTMTAIARGLAWAKDKEIKTVVKAAAGKTVSVSAYWDDPVSSNLPKDIAEAMAFALSTTYMNVVDLKGGILFYPAELWAFMNQPARPNEYTMLGMSPIEWVQQKYGVTFIPTRQLDAEAMLVFPGQWTALHMIYMGGDIPLVEYAREYGTGNKFYVTQMYSTLAMPNSTTDRLKNNRIILLSGVCQTRATRASS
ncbi:MAG: hypothetical protein M0R80_09940 [Proteobacteria bacterium]|jgi:hypothetical protein|nr:hypothetical protein [Pseudomonadota bacterium]